MLFSLSRCLGLSQQLCTLHLPSHMTAPFETGAASVTPTNGWQVPEHIDTPICLSSTPTEPDSIKLSSASLLRPLICLPICLLGSAVKASPNFPLCCSLWLHPGGAPSPALKWVPWWAWNQGELWNDSSGPSPAKSQSTPPDPVQLSSPGSRPLELHSGQEAQPPS